MNIVFLDADTLGEIEGIHKLEKFGTLVRYPFTNENEIPDRVSNADVIISNKVLIDKAAIDNAPNLKLICIAATGTNNVDLDYAAQKNIPVKNVVGYSTRSVAQFTFSSLFYLIHQSRYYDEYVKSGRYCKSKIFTHIHHDFWQLAGKTFGIIGLGNIGREVAKIAVAFGADIIYYSTSNVNREPKYKRVDLDELLRKSDVVSIHAPLNEKTRDLIGISELLKMQKHAILVNMGRGGIINEADLAHAIDENLIGGAALDVLENEPVRKDNPLLGVQNKEKLFISPHIAWSSIEARTTLIDVLCDHLEKLLEATDR